MFRRPILFQFYRHRQWRSILILIFGITSTMRSGILTSSNYEGSFENKTRIRAAFVLIRFDFLSSQQPTLSIFQHTSSQSILLIISVSKKMDPVLAYRHKKIIRLRYRLGTINSTLFSDISAVWPLASIRSLPL